MCGGWAWKPSVFAFRFAQATPDTLRPSVSSGCAARSPKGEAWWNRQFHELGLGPEKTAVLGLAAKNGVVYTENLSSGVVVMKAAQDGA